MPNAKRDTFMSLLVTPFNELNIELIIIIQREIVSIDPLLIKLIMAVYVPRITAI